MEFRILGPLEVCWEGRQISLGGAKQRAVLAVLLLHRNEVVSTHRLIDELWSDRPPATAAKVVQVYVSELRKALRGRRGRDEVDSILVTRAPGYVLRVEPGELDADRFEQLVDEGRRALAAGSPRLAAHTLLEGLALWRGPAFADFAHESFAQNEIARLEEARVSAVEERIDADLALGRQAELIGELESLVAAYPLRERLRGQLMLALYRSGRQAEALEAYHEARRLMVEELGIEPRRELRELQLAMLNQDPALDFVRQVEAAADPSRGIFVGREREFEELAVGLNDAFAGRGRLFLLVGEPGIGKSRLADELIGRARAGGARVVIGRCWEAGGAPAYWPWVQSLRAYVRETEPEALRAQLGAGATELAQLLPELRERFPDLPAPPVLESESARFRLFEAASSFLKDAARTRPLVLVLDDLHAADEPSLLLLQFLARQLGDSRLLVVGAYRNVDPIPTDPLTTTLTELIREPVTTSLALAGLGERDVARFIELMTGEAPSTEFVATIWEETEGNPLFVGEIVHLLSAEGSLSAHAPRLAIPQSVRDVIARRLRRLSEESNRVLVLASVLGREFTLEALARLGSVPEDELLDILDEAMAARVVSDVPGSPRSLRFAHGLIRDTLYEGLTAARRVRLHRLAVEVLEALYGDEPGPHIAELAHHSVAGSDFDKGLAYAHRAGDRALALLAYEESSRLYEMALDALDLAGASDERTHCELLLSLGEAQAQAGNTPAAKKAFLGAAEISRRLRLPSKLARAAAGYGGRIVFARAADDERLVPLLEEGLDALAEEDVELRARLLARLAGALRDEHSRDRRDALSREAVELARRTGNPAALAYALDGRAAAIIAPDTVAECLALGSELRDVAEGIGDRERIGYGHIHRFIAQVQIGDIRGAEVDLAAARRIADELRQPPGLWQVYGSLAMLALAEGRLDDAEELVLQAFEFGERALAVQAAPVYRVQRYTLCDFRGNLEDVEASICDLVAEYPARPVFRALLAHLQVRLGRLQEAKRVLDDLAGERFSALPFDMEWPFGMSLLAETSALLRDTDSAAVLYPLLLPWGATNVIDVPEGSRGSLSRYLGLLASTLQRWDDAARHFEDAMEMNELMGALPWLAHTQHDYARLLARGTADDRAKGDALLATALDTYRELGMATPPAKAESIAAR